MYKEHQKVVFLPKNKIYDFGYLGSTGKFILYEEGECNMQDSFATSPENIRPLIVTLCGSTKFKKEFIEANFRETMKGNIVLTVGWFSHSDKVKYFPSEKEKKNLDDLHKQKIDLSDEIFVINVRGYVGESTRSEIEYAKEKKKRVRYLVENPCKHKNTRYLDKPWPTGETIEVCNDCGMSRSHWELGESDWVMIADLPQAREDLQKSLNKITKENP